MQYIDTHCHLDILEQKAITITDALHSASASNITHILQIATSLESSRYNHNLIQQLSGVDGIPQLFYSAGIHPESVDGNQSTDATISFIRECIADPQFRAIGETGLDYYHNRENRHDQIEVFERHLQLAREINKPIILHLRDDRVYNPDHIDAFHDALQLVQQYQVNDGVLHCFTYSRREALAFVELGWKVSFSGIVTYKNATIIQEAAASVPLDSLLAETDAPFLAPTPHRGKTNQPAYVGETVEYLVELRNRINGEEKELIRESIYKNSLQLLTS